MFLMKHSEHPPNLTWNDPIVILLGFSYLIRNILMFLKNQNLNRVVYPTNDCLLVKCSNLIINDLLREKKDHFSPVVYPVTILLITNHLEMNAFFKGSYFLPIHSQKSLISF